MVKGVLLRDKLRECVSFWAKTRNLYVCYSGIEFCATITIEFAFHYKCSTNLVIKSHDNKPTYSRPRLMNMLNRRSDVPEWGPQKTA